MTWIIIFLLAIIATALGGLKVLALALIVAALIAIAVLSAAVGGFHKLADKGDELYERQERNQS